MAPRTLLLLIPPLVSGLVAGCGGSDHHDAYNDAPKVIIDSDFNTMGDDGQLFAMTSQLMGQGKVNLLGLCVVTGNDWLLQEEADALKAVERMGVQNRVGVYGGANYPLQYDVASIRAQQAANPNGYFGAWMRTEPTDTSQLTAPPDGFAQSTKLQTEAAADFMIDSIKRYPNQVTIIEVGPPTNLATAVKKAPEIVPLIKQIVYMGGAMNVPGNANAVGELNWWFDPVAVRTLLQTTIPQRVIPLDVTNTVPLTESVYNQIVNPPTGQTPVTQVYAVENASAFASHTDIYDTLTMPYFLDSTYATETPSAYLDIDTTPGEDQGHVRVYPNAPAPGASPQKITYVTKYDNNRFFNLYVNLLTSPVPVKFQ
ncbi:Nucleoside hydrolase [Burkholderia sp. 8Y]|uniref:nucleoside hydrolase n=1 Tax=Burkholderia sp. 8Y TaxID=2653133 RepID=UPI0012EFC87B|nr:nucleoside hydrolase [Burkholderia sp. 8Y]VXB39970.1 Nucleoside hydrolase [Burkholderia sp. 8Y]